MSWGVQFHLETTAENVRDWARNEGRPLTGRLGPVLDGAEDTMGEVWREFAFRFVAFARDFVPAEQEPPRRLLPVVAIDE